MQLTKWKDRHVAQTHIGHPKKGKFVSTVYIGYGDGEDYETMVFPHYKNWHEIDGERYATKEAALMGHALMVLKHSKKGN